MIREQRASRKAFKNPYLFSGRVKRNFQPVAYLVRILVVASTVLMPFKWLWPAGDFICSQALAQERPSESQPKVRNSDPEKESDKKATGDPGPKPSGDSGNDNKKSEGFERIIREVSEEDEEVQRLPETGDTPWDRYHDSLSRSIWISAEWIDSFFDDERFEAEENRTHIKWRLDTTVEEGEGVDLDTKARLRIALPRFEKRLSLVISGDPDEDPRQGTLDDDIGDNQPENEPESNITASLWYSIVDTYNRNIAMRAGAQWRDSKPVLWLGPRYRQLWNLDLWVARHTWSLRWFSDVGFESKMRLDFERQLTKRFFFRQTTSYNWNQEKDITVHLDDGSEEETTADNYNQVGFSLSVFQPLNRLSILEYAAGVTFVDKPEYVLDNIVLLVRYRRQVWRDWLFVEVTPQMDFWHSDDYNALPSILFRIEGIFGRR